VRKFTDLRPLRGVERPHCFSVLRLAWMERLCAQVRGNLHPLLGDGKTAFVARSKMGKRWFVFYGACPGFGRAVADAVPGRTWLFIKEENR
jgi:hypothetical protein